jgi:TM2 domain-containing membrane protein YozV
VQVKAQDSLLAFQPSFYDHLLRQHLYADAYRYLSIQRHLPDSFLLERLLLSRQLHRHGFKDKILLDSIKPFALQSLHGQKRYIALLAESNRIDKLHSLMQSSSFVAQHQELELTICMLEQKPLPLSDAYYPSSFRAILDKYHKFKPKSSLIAASLSVVPGLGKLYLGYTYQGLSALLVNSLLIAQMAESYQRAGPKSIRFGLTAGLFGIFYVGNIYGSYTAAKKRKHDFYHQIQYEIVHYYFSDTTVF